MAVKAVTFIILFLFIAVLVYIYPYSNSKGEKNSNGKKDGFTDFFHFNFGSMNDGTPPEFNSKNAVLPVKQPYSPQLAEAGVGNIDPSPVPPSSLPSAPFGSRSKGVPQPYKNPDTEPAKYIRILAVKEDLQAFFGFQASSLTDGGSDPSIQMPLTRARADLSELVDLQSVLERNPGLPSRITNKQLNDIQANLRYLQAMLRDLEASGVVPSGSSEGFTGTEGTVDAVTGDSLPNGPPATLAQLQDFRTKVFAEIHRLSASGTSDPVVTARINTLTLIQSDVDQVIADLHSGAITPDTVPIYASDIEKALPVLGSPTDPLPTVLKKFNLPPAIANLFPGGLSASNQEQAAQINNIMKGYMSQIFEGTSWGIDVKANVKYDSPRAALIGLGGMKVYDQTTDLTAGVPGVKGDSNTPDLNVTVDDGIKQSDPANNGYAYAIPGGQNTYDRGLPGTSSDRTFPAPKVGGLDWKERVKQIKTQVKRRGLDPAVFGAIPDNADVSDEFNWRGYTQMFCTRLAANTDPGLPVTVGCPPQEWAGWQGT